MKILLTNDDGYSAEGIAAMREALVKFADVTLVAPDTEMSAVGHAITIADPLRVKKVDKEGIKGFGYSVNGTPADCVKIGVKAIMDSIPDIVVSGINHGQNIATNVIYSGTVSAATEGMILGIPSIAISHASFKPGDFTSAVAIGVKMVKLVAEHGLPVGTLLNVNIPHTDNGKINGVKICRNGISKFSEEFERRVDLRNIDYYWQGGKMRIHSSDKGADIDWISKGFITVSPLKFDLTDHEFMADLEGWDI